MSMVMMALYTLAGAPMIFLVCRIRRTTIMSVRRMLSESEREKYPRPKLTAREVQILLFGREV